jgi:AbrB family looped-hinge helix DNA binding protein
MKSVVGERGQVTIPKRLRDRLGIVPGQIIEFEEDCGRLVGIKAGLDDDDLESLVGIVDLGMPVDEWMEELRGPRDLT